MAGDTIRYRCEFTSNDGIDWRIDIDDQEYLDSPTSFNVRGNGFEIDYKGENAQRFNPILSSECKVTAHVQDANFETLIDDILGAQEQRFFIRLYKYYDAAYNIYWAGPILQDLITKEDQDFPYDFVLTATDGIGALKDTPYDDDGTLYTGSDTFITHILNCLNKTGGEIFWTTNTFLKTAVNWYDTHHHNPSKIGFAIDPLERSRLDHDCFIEFDATETEVGMSTYDVLNQLCRAWGARIILSDGCWNFFQVNEYASATFTTREWDKTGTKVTQTENDDFTQATFNKLTGGISEFFPALQQVRVKYNYKQSTNPGNLLPPQDKYTTPVSIGTIQGGGNEALIVSGQVQSILSGAPNDWPDRHHVYKLQLRVGSYYLTNENGYMEWVADSSKYYEIITTQYHGSNYQYAFDEFGFTTPPVPADGAGTFLFDFIKHIDSAGENLVLTTGTFDHNCIDYKVSLYYDDQLQDGTIRYIAENTTDGTTLVDSSKILDLPDTIIGDGPGDYSIGRIETYDGSTWDNSSSWTVTQDGTGVDINKLLVKEVLVGQKTPTEILRASYVADYNAVQVLDISSEYYVFNGGSFNANMDEWRAEWFHISLDRTNINLPAASNEEPSPFPILSPVGSGGNSQSIVKISNVINIFGRLALKVYPSILTADYSIPFNSQYTVFHCDPTSAVFTITLTDYDTTTNSIFIIVNRSQTQSVIVGRETRPNDYMEGIRTNKTLRPNKIGIFQNTGIDTDIGWSFWEIEHGFVRSYDSGFSDDFGG